MSSKSNRISLFTPEVAAPVVVKSDKPRPVTIPKEKVDIEHSFRKSIGVGQLNGESYLQFSVSDGPGSRPHIDKLSNLESLHQTLLNISRNGIPDTNSHISMADMIMATIHVTPEGYKFRSSPTGTWETISPSDLSRLANVIGETKAKILAAHS